MVIEGKATLNVVQYITEKIRFKRETFLERPDGSVVAFHANILLDCPLNQRYCQVGNIRYVWEYPTKEHCPLLKVKNFRGYKVNSPQTSDTVLMSSDGSLIRLILKGHTEECGLRVIRTNYQELVVTLARNEDGSPKRNLITKDIKDNPRNVQLALYISNRDDSLYHTIVSRLRDEFRAVIQDNCQRNLDRAKLTHFLERRMPSFHTYRFGGENFLTTAGEVVYSYKCRPTLVKVLSTDKCYDALPVKAIDTSDPQLELPLYDSDQLMFIEPLTHRITGMASEKPCVRSFYDRYVDIFDRWFALTPGPQMMTAPNELDLSQIRESYNFSNLDGPDFSSSSAGIYDRGDINSLQYHLELGRAQTALTYKLAEQSADFATARYIAPGMLFPPESIPGGSWHNYILGKIWGWIRSLGEGASILLAFFFIARLVWFIGKILMNCKFIYNVHGISLHLLWSMCTEVLFSWNYNKARKTTYSNPRDRPYDGSDYSQSGYVPMSRFPRSRLPRSRSFDEGRTHHHHHRSGRREKARIYYDPSIPTCPPYRSTEQLHRGTPEPPHMVQTQPMPTSSIPPVVPAFSPDFIPPLRRSTGFADIPKAGEAIRSGIRDIPMSYSELKAKYPFVRITSEANPRLFPLPDPPNLPPLTPEGQRTGGTTSVPPPPGGGGPLLTTVKETTTSTAQPTRGSQAPQRQRHPTPPNTSGATPASGTAPQTLGASGALSPLPTVAIEDKDL